MILHQPPLRDHNEREQGFGKSTIFKPQHWRASQGILPPAGKLDADFAISLAFSCVTPQKTKPAGCGLCAGCGRDESGGDSVLELEFSARLLDAPAGLFQ